MAEIQVVYPPPLESKSGKINVPPVVHQDSKMASETEFVHWHIISQNKKVQKVRIVFKKEESAFFPDEPAPQQIERSVDSGAIIWGRAPDFGDEKQRRHKYDLVALDKHGNEIDDLFLDPEIVTDKPKGPPR